MKSFILAAILVLGSGSLVIAGSRASGEVKVGLGQTKTLTGTRLRVKFVEVLEDSRCPEDAECIWAGNAKLKITLSRNGKRSKTFEINTNGTDSVEFEGYRIELKDLMPKPRAGSGDKKAYRATFTAERIKR